jgi:hypothetical protein
MAKTKYMNKYSFKEKNEPQAIRPLLNRIARAMVNIAPMDWPATS